MNMVVMPADLHGVAFQRSTNSAEIIPKANFYIGICEERAARFGAKRDMGINFG